MLLRAPRSLFRCWLFLTEIAEESKRQRREAPCHVYAPSQYLPRDKRWHSESHGLEALLPGLFSYVVGRWGFVLAAGRFGTKTVVAEYGGPLS